MTDGDQGPRQEVSEGLQQAEGRRETEAEKDTEKFLHVMLSLTIVLVDAVC